MTVIDAFMFFNEFDVLEWRLHELDDVVDRFVLVESSHTFQGQEKPLYFREQLRRRRFERWLPRIEHVVVQDSPAQVSHPMVREAFQRNQIVRGLRSLNADQYDIVLLSDVDEIPSAAKVRSLALLAVSGTKFGQKLYHDFINLHCQTHPIWYGTRSMFAGPLIDGRYTAQQLRLENNLVPIEEAGWHFSFLGGVEKMQAKLAAWSHFEWNKPPFNTPENLARARAEGRDWDTDRQMQYHWVPVDASYPPYLLDQLAAGRFREHVGPPEEAL